MATANIFHLSLAPMSSTRYVAPAALLSPCLGKISWPAAILDQPCRRLIIVETWCDRAVVQADFSGPGTATGLRGNGQPLFIRMSAATIAACELDSGRGNRGSRRLCSSPLLSSCHGRRDRANAGEEMVSLQDASPSLTRVKETRQGQSGPPFEWGLPKVGTGQN